MEFRRPPFWNLPNALTVLRIGVIPVLIILMQFPGRLVSFPRRRGISGGRDDRPAWTASSPAGSSWSAGSASCWTR